MSRAILRRAWLFPIVLVVFAWTLLFFKATTAQPTLTSLSGTVVGQDGSAVSEAPVRAQNLETGTDRRTYSSATGRYEIQALPAGDYILSVEMPCCAFAPYVNESVVLEPGQPLEFEIRLAEGISLNTLGDDPGTINAEIRNRQVIPDLPVPRTSDERPDLSGVWLIRGDPFPEQASLLPWAEDVFQERIANDLADHPHTRCLPTEPSIPGGATPFIVKFLQMPDLLAILIEEVPGFRQVFLDGRDHPENPNPSWMGHSIGRWEGDTLIVDTVGFNDRGWSGIYPRTEMMHLEERFSRQTYGYMDVRATIEDPGVFTEPWVRNLRFNLAPQEELIEYVCENNKWAPE